MEWLLKKLNNGEDLNIVGFYGSYLYTEKERAFSMFYNTLINIDLSDGTRLTFNSAGQYFIYMKAKFFNDKQAERIIMENGLKPTDYKRISKKIKNYDSNKWNELSDKLMYEAVYQKFKQNGRLKQQLLETTDAVLVETSSNDLKWGSGLGKYQKNHKINPLWDNPDRWKGENRLGFIIMQVRDRIKQEEALKELNNID